MSKNLPITFDQLRGLRAARWTRESTVGQGDNFGPDAQRDQQDRAIERYGLVDSGIAWSVAHSGRTVNTTPEWADMIAQAGVDYDVLVVGYVSRFARDVRTAVNARHDMHEAGAVLLFADERVLSSDDNAWDTWAREVVEAESYSRKLAKRVAEGYAQKRRRLGTPGGRFAPLGFSRVGKPPVLVINPDTLPIVVRAYDLASSGMLDRDVAKALGLKLTHVRELLTNPVYIGRLLRGEPSAVGAVIDQALWDKVQTQRARFSHRPRGPVTNRRYALGGLLHCAHCGRRITGHCGRYRHVEACEAFQAAKPPMRQRSSESIDRRIRGESYNADWYDSIFEQALRRVSANAALVAETVEILNDQRSPGNEFTLARIARDRDVATARLQRDRDVRAWEADMARLDAEEALAIERPATSPTAAQAVDYWHDVSKLWVDTDDDGRRRIAESLVDRIEVSGLQMVGVPTAEAEAYGVVAMFGDDPLACQIRRYGRGERI